MPNIFPYEQPVLPHTDPKTSSYGPAGKRQHPDAGKNS